MSDGETRPTTDDDRADERTVPTTSVLADVLLGLLNAGARHLSEHPDKGREYVRFLTALGDVDGEAVGSRPPRRRRPAPAPPEDSTPVGSTPGRGDRQHERARIPTDVGAERMRAAMKDPRFDSTVRALKDVLMPAMLVELQPIWQAALSRAEEERTGDGPILAFNLVRSNPALQAELDGILELCREALLFAFDAAVPAAMEVMDAMLAARYLGLQIERPDRERRGTAAGDNGTEPGTE